MDIPYGYCHCGCGQKTNVAKCSTRKRGYIRGEPLKYLHGHGGSDTPENRFWSNTEVGNSDECWMWKGTPSAMGYGTISVHGEHLYAHRYSWILHNGPIPDYNGHCGTMVIRHKCDNPLCVNPNHLEIGTQQDNLKDCDERGHRPKGSEHWHAKLSEKDVEEIKKLHTDGVTGREISRRKNISEGTVSGIVNGTHWKHTSRR